MIVIGSMQKNAYIGFGDICPTLTSAMGMGGGHIPMIMEETNRPIVIGQMDNTIDRTFESANRVYDPNGIAPTQHGFGGGGHETKIIVEENDD